MPLSLTPVITASKKNYSDGYKYYNLSEKFFGGMMDPVLMVDHFQMKEPTFPPHPYAGYSAVTYIFADSPGGIRSRDSLGNDDLVQPGELQWTMAGRGMMHEEVPLGSDQAVEGLKILVNLSGAAKKQEPQVFHVTKEQIPEWSPSPAIKVRVLSGRLSGVESPLKLPEPFTFLDVKIKARMGFRARVLMDSGAILYVTKGKIRLTAEDEVSQLESYQAIGAQTEDNDGELLIDALEDSHFIFLSGKVLAEPIISHGPFVMNSSEEITSAIEAYQRGEMGKLDPSS